VRSGWNVPSKADVEPKGWPDVITIFLRSLARNWGGKLVAVIVSGLDADGAEALKEIKEAGGITSHRRPTQPSGRICLQRHKNRVYRFYSFS